MRPSGVPQIPINLLSGHTAYLPSIERERLAISMFCGRADKIMLGVHGKFDDTTQGVAGLGWDQGSAVIGDYKEFAQLISSFLMPRKSYKLSLIVCFGARSQNYRVNHDGDLAEEDIKSSFAYKFFKEICTKADVTLTARTGSVAFDSQTGRSLVQSEAAVKAEIESAEIQAAEYTKRIARDYEQLGRFMNATEEGRGKFFKMLDRMSEPAAKPRNKPERTIKEYNDIRTRVTTLSTQSANLVSKYGKFVYIYDDRAVTVCRKYEGHQKVMKVLYHGEL